MTTSQKFLDTTSHNLAWVFKRYQANELELSAPFQRNPVWSISQKSYLIDTILRGYPIPELYIQEYTDADGEDRYVVVDGQQRLRACVEFMGNEFALVKSGKEEIIGEGLFFSDLNDDQKKMIYNYNFIVRKLPEMSDTEIRAVFSRINRNTVALNQQELRHSTYWGPFIRTMELLAQHPRWKDIGIFSANDIRRMNDVEYISELAISLLHGTQNKKSSLDKWYAAYEENFDEAGIVIRVFRRALTEIFESLPEISRTRFSKKSDFYTLFELFSRERRSIGDLSYVELNRKLTCFANLVDEYIENPEIEPAPEPFVRSYVAGVERAASDLGNRKRRLEALMEAIEKL